MRNGAIIFPNCEQGSFHENDHASSSRNEKIPTSESYRDYRSTDIDGETEIGSPEKDETESVCERLLEPCVTDDDDLEDKLTEVWGSVSEDILQSVFHEWMKRLEWVREHEGEYYINPY
jgi:hypothetical protein